MKLKDIKGFPKKKKGETAISQMSGDGGYNTAIDEIANTEIEIDGERATSIIAKNVYYVGKLRLPRFDKAAQAIAKECPVRRKK